MKRRITLCLFSLCLLVYSCDDSSAGSSIFSSTPREKTADEIRAELKQKEQQEFYKYIAAKSSMRKNLIGETVLEGTISNLAALSSFKDIVFEITFISKTGTEIDIQNHIVHELIGPQKLIRFKIKTITSKAATDFSFRLIGATPI
jgi:hypothetical protein